MSLNLAEILEEHVVNGVETVKDTASYVSNKLIEAGYPRLSPEIYNLQRKINFVPQDRKERMLSFVEDTLSDHRETYNKIRDEENEIKEILKEKGMKFKGPGAYAEIPMIIAAEGNQETVSVDGLKNTKIKVSYEIDLNLDENAHSNMENYTFSSRYGKHSQLHLKGVWEADREALKCEVKAPSIPKYVSLEAEEAKLKYFQLLKEARENNFTGFMPSEKFRTLWIPREEDFLIELEEEQEEYVNFDPALVLRVADKYDHVIKLWDTNTEEPIEFLVRRHLENNE